MKSLWWFYQNLPLCKNPPQDLDEIRDRCPAIIREKVMDLISVINNNKHPFLTNINLDECVIYKNGSGRILKKSFSSFSALSKSLDENAELTCDANNNGFPRSTSTVNLSNGHLKMKA